MKQKYLYSIFLVSCIIKAQSYTLNDCIQIALDGKKTVLSASIDVNTAKKELAANYKLFKDKGYDSWVCTFLKKGITFI